MKKHLSPARVFPLLAILFCSIACNEPVKKDLPKEKDHPKLVKNIGSPKYGNVQCILQDKTGNLWFGTTQNGLYKYDGTSFRQFLMADGLNSNSVYCLLQDKEGKIWIGTEAGLCTYDGRSFTVVPVPLPKNLPPNKNEYYQNSHWVYSIMQDKSGKLWFVTIDGIYIYDGKVFSPFMINEAQSGFLTGNDKAERILQDKDGNTWFGGRTNEGAFRYDGRSVINFKVETLFHKGPKPKPHNWAWPQLQDRNGHIWFSNWGGAYRYDGHTFTGFTQKDGLPGMVACIIEDKKGNLWFGGDGLTRYDGRSFTHFTAKDGLTTSGVWSVLEDKSGNLWVGTRETGLFLFDGKTFIPYSEYKH